MKLAFDKTAAWMQVKSFFPGIQNPVFHATSGGKGSSILFRGEGLKVDSGTSRFGPGNVDGVSISRNLPFLLKGHFGNVIIVLDRTELSQRFPIKPVAYNNGKWMDEFEERILTKQIPATMIRGVILNSKLLRFQLSEWAELPFPVVYRSREGWIAVPKEPIKTAALVSTDTAQIYALSPEMLALLIDGGKWKALWDEYKASHLDADLITLWGKLDTLVRGHGGAVFYTGADGDWDVTIKDIVGEQGHESNTVTKRVAARYLKDKV